MEECKLKGKQIHTFEKRNTQTKATNGQFSNKLAQLSSKTAGRGAQFNSF